MYVDGGGQICFHPGGRPRLMPPTSRQYKREWNQRHAGKCLDCGAPLGGPDSARCRSCSKKGARNPAFHGGSDTSGRKQARAILAAGPCELCGARATYVHHKDEDPQNNAPGNLQRLCPPCHRQTHDRRPCNIPGCDRPSSSRQGWCRLHYRRWKRNGDPLKLQRPAWDLRSRPAGTC